MATSVVSKFEVWKKGGFFVDAPQTAVIRLINLIVVSVADLGFECRAKYEDICMKSQEFGLSLCPEGIMLTDLLLQIHGDMDRHEEPLSGKRLYLSTDHPDKTNNRGIFVIEMKDGHVKMKHENRGSGDTFEPDCMFIFALPYDSVLRSRTPC